MQDYLTCAKNIASDASDIALRYFGFQTETTWKGDNTPLTQADTEINQYVIDEIQTAYPEHGVIGEEMSNIKNDAEFVWVCDPIDGTVPFSCGLGMFTFSLALVERKNGQPILGVINDPIAKNMYWACKDMGAYRNGEPIHVNDNATLMSTYMTVEGAKNDHFSNPKTAEALHHVGAKVLRLYSVIYGGVQVPNGKFAGTIFFNPWAHDVAALKILTEEAGGMVTDLHGNQRRYDEDGAGAVFSNGTLHQEILKYIT